ncbi:MAG: PilZ domain-containing protein, partial [Chloroflexota bacterium]
ELGELIVAPDALPRWVIRGHQIAVDFTDVSGTYHVAGPVQDARPGPDATLVITVRWAMRVQLRRFVRVPVLITPEHLEAQDQSGVSGTPGEWHAVTGQIIDVSLGGIGLVVGEPLAGGTRLHAEFELPGRFGLLAISGQVVTPPGPAEARTSAQARLTKAALRPVYRRGVAFDPLGADDLRRLQRALYHRQVALRRLGDPSPARHPAPEPAPLPAPPVRPRWRFWSGA